MHMSLMLFICSRSPAADPTSLLTRGLLIDEELKCARWEASLWPMVLPSDGRRDFVFMYQLG
jgi:hypothetical protein